jgi:hypothetical protein
MAGLLILGVMNELFNLLESHGFVTLPDITKLAALPVRKLEKLHRAVFNHIYEAQNNRLFDAEHAPSEAFSFHASASLRGASGCTSIPCRLNKLDFVGRYAALYANELTFPLSMIRPKPDQEVSDIREFLAHDFMALLFLRPVITAKVIVPVVMRSRHCVHEIEWMRESSESLASSTDRVAVM